VGGARTATKTPRARRCCCQFMIRDGLLEQCDSEHRTDCHHVALPRAMPSLCPFRHPAASASATAGRCPPASSLFWAFFAVRCRQHAASQAVNCARCSGPLGPQRTAAAAATCCCCLVPLPVQQRRT
jgi:hypothetical protein